MVYHGYGWELKVKHALQGQGYVVFKCSRRSYCDFVCIMIMNDEKGKRVNIKLVECKTRIDKMYLKDREIKQAHALMKLHKKHGFPVEYHIKVKDKIEVLTIEQFFQKHMVGK